MKGAGWRSAGFALLPALLIGAPTAAVFIDGPPPAHTGGFGEPTCSACHFDVEADPAGTLSLKGLPESYSPGARYLLILRLRRPGAASGGFELSARIAEGAEKGAQAGSLSAVGEGTAVLREAGVDYFFNTRGSTEPDSGGSTAWTLEWTAPERPVGPVVFHFVGNAADGDESQFGDHIYADSIVLPPAGSR